MSDIMWKIGGEGAKFALEPDGYGSFQDKFPHGVVFDVEKDDPAKSWPYVHPGARDAWAGEQRHAFVVKFYSDGNTVIAEVRGFGITTLRVKLGPSPNTRHLTPVQ